MTFIDWLLGRYRAEFVPRWTSERAQYYERLTYRYLGIRPEPIFTWSRKFRPKAKLEAVTKMKRSA